jgi:hypothetical protein
VTWGGSDVRLVPPPTTVADTLAGADTLTSGAAEARSYGPLLLAGTQADGRVTLAVVGEIQGDEIVPIATAVEEVERVARVTGSGSEWILFSDGVRVGTLTVDSASVSPSYCPARQTVTGVIELVPQASAAERLLALPSSVGRERGYGAFDPLDDAFAQRAATISWAGEAIPRNQATYPPNGLAAARQDIRVFRPLGAPGPAVAATFMYRDQLQVSPSPQGAYALFLLGSQRGGQYLEDFAWYSPSAGGGKRAPRFFDHLDWDGDGDTEVLVEVLGAERRWFASLAQRDGQWVQTFQDACGTGPVTGG